ncbi:btk-binding protein-related [Anaeramoeba flamelloides]|uniref:Btk-binding protein-related n=1 Tax=Anaeramoeba flamelloides TaxID=1746091 RepID=A0ABQ8XEF3_9EUKA|nr:btk-binding protein-related [Anaeramoeba flamelloides]
MTNQKKETITFGYLESMSKNFFHSIKTPFKSPIRMLTSGNSNICFVLENGECWEHKLAYSASNFGLSEFIKHDIEPIDRCASGYSHYLLISKSGSVYGRNINSFHYGQMGSGENISFTKPTKIKFFDKLKKEEGIEVVDVKGAVYSSFYLCNNGDLYSSGYNNSGECLLPKWNQNYFTPELVSKNVKKIWGENYSWKAFFQTNDNKVFCKTNSFQGNPRFFEVSSLPIFKDQIILEVASSCSTMLLLTQSTNSEKQFLHYTTDIYQHSTYHKVDLTRVNSPLKGISSSQSNFLTTTQNNDIYCVRNKALHQITNGVPEMEGEFNRERYVACSCSCGFSASVVPSSKCSISNDLLQLYQNQTFVDCEIAQGIKGHKVWVELRLSKTIKEIQETILQAQWGKEKIDSLMHWVYSNSYRGIKQIKEFGGLTSNPNLYKNSIKNDLLALYKNEETKNFTIKVKIDDEDQDEENEEDEDFEEIPVHKFILIARSGLFREMFKTLNENEEDNSVKDFSGKTPESLEIFFKYLYTNTLELTADDDPQLTAEELEDASEYYQLTEKISLQNEIRKIKKQFKL